SLGVGMAIAVAGSAAVMAGLGLYGALTGRVARDQELLRLAGAPRMRTAQRSTTTLVPTDANRHNATASGCACRTQPDDVRSPSFALDCSGFPDGSRGMSWNPIAALSPRANRTK